MGFGDQKPFGFEEEVFGVWEVRSPLPPFCCGLALLEMGDCTSENFWVNSEESRLEKLFMGFDLKLARPPRLIEQIVGSKVAREEDQQLC